EDSKTLAGTLFKNAAPTILRPVADLWANENFMGAPVYQENFPGGTPKPDSTLGRRSTPEAYKAFAGWLNRVSGGSQYRSGVTDAADCGYQPCPGWLCDGAGCCRGGLQCGDKKYSARRTAVGAAGYMVIRGSRCRRAALPDVSPAAG
ncbi:hypothetical protein VQ246_003607, partial [Salmonella enterica]|nr:hypothetical protein [Salmonella enterica]EMD4035982.1 hypothetical protein [Salmonella enterica]EMD4320305.1 hypothetical protein [Salmonella enterica]